MARENSNQILSVPLGGKIGTISILLTQPHHSEHSLLNRVNQVCNRKNPVYQFSSFYTFCQCHYHTFQGKSICRLTLQGCLKIRRGRGRGATEIEGKGFDFMVARIWRGAGILSPPLVPTALQSYILTYLCEF